MNYNKEWLTACRMNDVKTLQRYIDEGEDIAQDNGSGYTGLHYAARFEGHDCLQILLMSGAIADSQDSIGWTPLHCAAGENDVESIRLLLLYGANPNIEDQANETPLCKAIRFGHLESVQCLLDHGATPFVKFNGVIFDIKGDREYDVFGEPGDSLALSRIMSNSPAFSRSFSSHTLSASQNRLEMTRLLCNAQERWQLNEMVDESILAKPGAKNRL